MSNIIDVTLRLIDNFTRPMRSSMTQLERSSRSFQRAGKEITKAGKNISKVGSSLTKSVTVPIVGMGAAAIKAGVDFNAAFTGMKKTIDATPKQLKNISNELRNMSKETGVSAVELAGVAEIAGQLGIDPKNITNFTKVITDLSVSTNLAKEEGATAFAQFANVTKMNQTEMENLGSSLVALENNFATTESDIMNMATRLAGAGSQIGLSQGEILGFATALSSVGIQAEMGGSAFSKAMKNMKMATAMGLTQVEDLTKKTGISLRELQLMSQNDTKSFKEMAQSIGMGKDEVNDIIKYGVQLQGFSEIVGMTTEQFKNLFESHPEQALNSFIQGLGDTKKAGKSTIEMLQDMGFTEVRLSDSLTRLANNSDGVTKAMKMGEQAFKEKTALEKESSQFYDTYESRLKKLKSSINDLGITLSDILIPPMMQIIDKVDKAVTAFSKLDKGTQTQIVKFAAFAAGTGPVLSIFGKMTQGVGNTVTRLGMLGNALPKISQRAGAAKAVLAGIQWPKIKLPKIPMPKGIQKIGSLFGKIGSSSLSMVAKAGRAAKQFGSIVWNTSGMTAIRLVASRTGDALGFMATPFVKFGKTAAGGMGKLGKAFGGVGKAIFTFLGPAGTTILVLAAIVAAGILVYKNWDKIKKGAKALGKTIKDIFKASGIDVGAFKEQVSGLVEKAKNILAQFKSAGKEISPVFKKILNFVSGTFVAGIKVGFGAVVGFASGFLKSAVDVADGVLTAIGGITKFISGVFSGNWKKAWEGVKEIFSGIFKTFVGIAKTPINGVIGLVNGAINRLNKIGIKFPKWVPGLGGKDFKINIPTIPMLYKGTSNWGGGPAMIHDRGAEIVDLPSGTRVYPHDKSLQMARAEGAKSGKVQIVINKLADKIEVRSNEDIENLANAVVRKLVKELCDTDLNMGAIEIGDLA